MSRTEKDVVSSGKPESDRLRGSCFPIPAIGTNRRKRVAIATGYFPPSNLASVHRARLWAQHLVEFGWEPIIVTAHPKYYEEKLDPALLDLVKPGLRVISTAAIPVKPIRFIGDIGVRAFYWQRKALAELVTREEIDFLHITIPSNYLALLGELLYRRYRLPFGIDYQDPWVHPWPGVERYFSKAWSSYQLGKWLEPIAVRNASLITGITPLHFAAVFERNPQLRDRCVTAAMPVGDSEQDYELALEAHRRTFLFSADDGLFHLMYAGTMWPKASAVLERFMEALAVLGHSEPELMERLRVHFVGTGKAPNDPVGQIRPYIKRFKLEKWVDEHASRIGYVDVLRHLASVSAILIIGSTEPHYTPSKIFQSVQAKRPIFAILHEQSSAVDIIRTSQAGHVVTVSESRLPTAEMLAHELATFIRDQKYSADKVKWDVFESFSARNSARILAAALDDALDRSLRYKDHST